MDLNKFDAIIERGGNDANIDVADLGCLIDLVRKQEAALREQEATVKESLNVAGELPELPSNKLATTYTADQMHAYGRACIAAARPAIWYEGCDTALAHGPTKTEGCAGFQGKPVADCGVCSGAGCDASPAAPAKECLTAELTDERIDQIARDHNLDGSMLNQPRRAYWRMFAKAIQREAAADDVAYRSARDLAVAIWRANYSKISPDFQPLPDLLGVLSQIDNMTAGMSRAMALATPPASAQAVAPAQVEQEPIGYAPDYLADRLKAGDAGVMVTIVAKPQPGFVDTPIYTRPQAAQPAAQDSVERQAYDALKAERDSYKARAEKAELQVDQHDYNRGAEEIAAQAAYLTGNGSDAARLDFLQKNSAYKIGAGKTLFMIGEYDVPGRIVDIRAAIDAAILAAPAAPTGSGE